MVVSNIPGPARPLELLGHRLERLVAFIPLFPGQRASVGVVRYAGQLFFGVTEALESPEGGARLAEDLRDELTSLESEGAAGGEAA